MSGFRKLFKGKNKASSPPSELDGLRSQSPSPPSGQIQEGDTGGDLPPSASSSSTPGILPSADAIEASGAAYVRAAAAASRRPSASASPSAAAESTRANDVEQLRQTLLNGSSITAEDANGDHATSSSTRTNGTAPAAAGGGSSSRVSALSSAAPSGANLRITSSNHRAAAAAATDAGDEDLNEDGTEDDASSSTRKNKKKGSAGVVSAPSSRRGSMSDEKRQPGAAAATSTVNGTTAAEQKLNGSKTPTSPRAVAFDNVKAEDEHDAEDDGVARIEFYHRDAPYFWLSNSSDHAVVLDGIRYPTAEHLFQASKFPHRPDLASRIRKAPSPNAALRLARTHAQQVRKGWIGGGINVLVMNHVLLLKFTQHSVLRDELLRTGDADLIEASPNEVFWGSGLALGQGSLTGNFRGRNEKGKALMRTREQLRAAAGLGWGSGAITV